MENNILNIPEVAQYLGVGINTAYDLAKEEGFPSLRIGKRILVPHKALEEWIVANLGQNKNLLNHDRKVS